MGLIIIAALLIGLYLALEPAHRRASGLPRTRFGDDTASDRDSARLRADLRARPL